MNIIISHNYNDDLNLYNYADGLAVHIDLFTPFGSPLLLCPQAYRLWSLMDAIHIVPIHTVTMHIVSIHTVESRIGPKRCSGLTPGEVLIISRPNPYPKSEKPPAWKWFSKPNL